MVRKVSASQAMRKGDVRRGGCGGSRCWSSLVAGASAQLAVAVSALRHLSCLLVKEQASNLLQPLL